jgi:hypothetical protein
MDEWKNHVLSKVAAIKKGRSSFFFCISELCIKLNPDATLSPVTVDGLQKV